jgi:23S rRNA (adenine2503-C2)-methyltransferase
MEGVVPGAGVAPPRRTLRPLPPPRTWRPPTGPDGQPLIDVKGMLPAELGALCASWGEPAYRGRQLFAGLHGRGARTFGAITVLPTPLRRRLEAVATPQVFRLLARRADPADGTVKYLFGLDDGETVETVLMRYRFGYSACVSSQVGCRMGCRFCASTIGGRVRNLTAGEMAEQVVALNRELGDARLRGDPEAFPPGDGADAAEGDPAAGPPGPGARFDRVGRVVVMGMGEPLENLEAVLRFLRLIHEPEGCGIGWRHMTVSTSGLVAGIDALAEARMPVTLAVSLHAPNDELRDRLVPLNRRHPLAELLAACRRYVRATGRRITFEYVLLGGVNDLPEHARELARLLRGLQCHINLIPYNPVPERPFRASTPAATERFRGLLRGAGVPATVRRQLGLGIDAACGQLRRREAPAHAPAGR